MSNLLAVDLFIHDKYVIVGWPQAAMIGIVSLPILAGIVWVFVRRRR